MLGAVWAGSFQGPSPEGACLSSKPTARQAELTGESERVPCLGLASVFCHTLELPNYVHPVNPLFCVGPSLVLVRHGLHCWEPAEGQRLPGTLHFMLSKRGRDASALVQDWG